MEQIYTFFDGNFFQTLVILIVGFFVFISYKLTKNDERKNAALIVLMEIRGIEDQLLKLKDARDYYITSPVMSTNEWNKYKHMLIDEMDYDEYNVIEGFYHLAERIERERKLLREQIEITIKEKARAFQEQAATIANQMWDQEKQTYDERVKKISDLFFRSTPEFSGRFTRELMVKLLQEINPVTTTTAGLKIKKIAKEAK